MEIDFLYVAQIFAEEVWRSVYVTSSKVEARESFEEVLDILAEEEWNVPTRLVAFKVSGVDFIATHARGFEVLDGRA